MHGAAGIATAAGLSDLVIGATVIAAGISLPEITTSVVAAARRQAEIAITNVIWPNIFNLLGALGLSAAITGLPLDSSSLHRFEIAALAVSTLALVLLV